VQAKCKICVRTLATAAERRHPGGGAVPGNPFRENGRDPPRCPCGFAREHPMVSPSPEYSFFGWAFILLGVSWRPLRILFVCRVCTFELDRIDDPKEMARVRLAG
jgi:hypothetical protein